ncbi:MAG: photosynthetic complex putative assembly protein PuhB [Betaproteobacteria bacterium]
MKPAAAAFAKAPHRGQEHEFEPQFGLPERLPASERLLWQGQPLPGLVARRVFHLPLVTAYFGVMLAWRIGAQLQDGLPLLAALRGSLVLALLAAVAIGILAALARLTASTTAYTLTDKRIVMRIGIVLTVTYNLPLRHLDAAHLLPLGGGRGEIALQLRGDTRIAYLHLWPHARPWLFARTQPMLRCLADAQGVSRQLAEAWAAVNAQAARPEAANGPASLGLQPQGQAA